MSEEIAKILVDIGSVNFSFKNYFTLTSGLKSPVYVDCRKIISFVDEIKMADAIWSATIVDKK